MIATKEQERKALEKIRKIVDDLGPDSYLSFAFEGCFDDAETNITNDWALSMNGRWQDAEQRADKAEAELKELRDQIKDLETRASHAEQLYNTTQASADRWVAKYHETDDEWTRCYNQMVDKYNEASTRAEALELENMKLKAKLYDMMTGA